MQARWDGVSKFIRREAILVSSALGALLLLVSIKVGTTTTVGAPIVAIAGAVLAAAALALISVNREDLLEALLGQGVETVFDSRRRYCTDDFWSGLLKSSKGHYRVLGVANHGYLGTQAARDRFGGEFREAIMRGVSVEVLWLSPDTNRGLEREQEEGRRTRGDITKSILWFAEMRRLLPADARRRLMLKEYELTPTCGLTWSDSRLVVTHYVIGQANLDSPGWVLTTTSYPFYRRLLEVLHLIRVRDNPLPKVYLDTYREVQQKAVEITADRIAVLREKVQEYEAVAKPSEAELREERDAQAEVDND